jgi:hypothetical protein
MPAETTGRTPTYSAGSGGCSRSTPEVAPRGPTGRVSSMPSGARSFASKPRAGRYQHQEHVDTLQNRWSSGNVKQHSRASDPSSVLRRLRQRRGSAAKYTVSSRSEKMNGFRSIAGCVRAYRRSCDQQDRRTATMEPEADGLTHITPVE